MFQIVSVAFEGCGKPYPIICFQDKLGCPDAKTSPIEALSYICQELRRTNATVIKFHADTPERHAAMGISVATTGRYW